jgi:hypothetical protein
MDIAASPPVVSTSPVAVSVGTRQGVIRKPAEQLLHSTHTDADSVSESHKRRRLIVQYSDDDDDDDDIILPIIGGTPSRCSSSRPAAFANPVGHDSKQPAPSSAPAPSPAPSPSPAPAPSPAPSPAQSADAPSRIIISLTDSDTDEPSASSDL